MGKQNTEAWPVNGDTYYWVRSDIGDICESKWVDGLRKHEFKRSIGNIFRSIADARLAIAKQQARAEAIERAKK